MAFSNPCPPSTIRQYAVLEQHRREQVYNIAGNHDASPFGAPTSEGREVNWWFRKWADPIGEQSGVDPAKRPYPIDGTWERYTFKVENLRFLMMSDRNDLPYPVGRRAAGGASPAGAVTAENLFLVEKASRIVSRRDRRDLPSPPAA